MAAWRQSPVGVVPQLGVPSSDLNYITEYNRIHRLASEVIKVRKHTEARAHTRTHVCVLATPENFLLRVVVQKA